MTNGREETFVSIDAPSLTIKLGGKTQQFVHGVLKLSGRELKEMEDLLNDPDKVSVRQLVRKLDREKAIAISQEFQERMKRQNSAIAGGTNSAILRQMAEEALEKRDAQLRDASPEDMAKMHEQIGEDLTMTEKAGEQVEPIENRDLPEGFIPDEKPEAEIVEDQQALASHGTAEAALSQLLGNLSNTEAAPETPETPVEQPGQENEPGSQNAS